MLFTTVLVPYKITLLSNMLKNGNPFSLVLVPYKITLLSNDSVERINPYEF